LNEVAGAIEAGEGAARDVVPNVEGAAKLKLVRAENATIDAAINTARHDLMMRLP
jgi:hypothetical protein